MYTTTKDRSEFLNKNLARKIAWSSDSDPILLPKLKNVLYIFYNPCLSLKVSKINIYKEILIEPIPWNENDKDKRDLDKEVTTIMDSWDHVVRGEYLLQGM